MQSEIQQRIQRNLGQKSLLAHRNRMRAQYSPSLAYGRHFAPPLPDVKQAAVMIMLEPREGEWSIPLTVRPKHLPDHPGQISFPGGRLEAGETHCQAAEREFREELGIAEFPGTIIGELQPIYVYNSNYFVRPFIAITDRTQTYVPCSYEVERVIHLPLRLLEPQSIATDAMFARGRVQWRARTLAHNLDQVWGATAILLGELSAVLSLPNA